MDKNSSNQKIIDIEKIKMSQSHQSHQVEQLQDQLEELKRQQDKIISENLQEKVKRELRDKWLRWLIGIPSSLGVVGFLFLFRFINWVHEELLKLPLG